MLPLLSLSLWLSLCLSLSLSLSVSLSVSVCLSLSLSLSLSGLFLQPFICRYPIHNQLSWSSFDRLHFIFPSVIYTQHQLFLWSVDSVSIRVHKRTYTDILIYDFGPT